jgi:hypothetical protein
MRSRLRRTTTAVTVVAAALLAPAAAARAQVTFDVTFDDPGSACAPHHADLLAHTLAAGEQWVSLLPVTAPGPVDISVFVGCSTAIPRGTGRSFTSGFVTNVGGIDLFQEGLPFELATGVDPNGAGIDVELMFNPDYLNDNLWFDPDPSLRTAPIPALRTDAFSVLLHEFGHAFGFNGWRSGTTGALPGTFQGMFDQWVAVTAGDLFFVGPSAMAIYGGPVPLTFGNYGHIGNAAPRPGADLLPFLMNGVVFDFQTRYDIAPLELAMLADAGVVRPSVAPEPTTGALLALVLVPAAAVLRRRRRTA